MRPALLFACAMLIYRTVSFRIQVASLARRSLATVNAVGAGFASGYSNSGYYEGLISDVLRQSISDMCSDSCSSVLGSSYALLTRQSVNLKGDYRSAAAMPLAKLLKKKPVDVANGLRQNMIKLFPEGERWIGVDVSGPGFLTFELKDELVLRQLMKMIASSKSKFGLGEVGCRKRVVVDFSSPNIAKDMHVGHLRSTIIGDSCSRVLEYLGYDVLRLNHVGDWGTQFGMLIHYLKVNHPDLVQKLVSVTNDSATDLSEAVPDLSTFYKLAKAQFDQDPNFKEASKIEVTLLQSGNQLSFAVWKGICEISRREYQKIYDELGIKITERGESFYNDMLPGVVEDLLRKGVAVETEGAIGCFVDGFQGTDGSPLPLLIQKADGGYLYGTTDVAAVKQRVDVEHAHACVYVVDKGQANHFKMVFKTARAAGYVPDDVSLLHVQFGLVLGEDGKKFKVCRS